MSLVVDRTGRMLLALALAVPTLVAGDFSDTADPVMEAALSRLRKIPQSKRAPARR